ncbi:hypothetical protein T07_366 [Trichinella nelsoni]|uniref:Uncharacterized protein n=1 Tax=Trichinella nelsoni TaxID=6336 RepID=A0A0V0RXL0_9BILA|nr:hypothetical protein T07_366 [Trichinella nelsoni]
MLKTEKFLVSVPFLTWLLNADGNGSERTGYYNKCEKVMTMDYTFAIKELLCRYRSNPVLVEVHINKVLCIHCRCHSVLAPFWHSGVSCLYLCSLAYGNEYGIRLYGYGNAIETVKLTGIQSLCILKMWQFDYAFSAKNHEFATDFVLTYHPLEGYLIPCRCHFILVPSWKEALPGSLPMAQLR